MAWRAAAQKGRRRRGGGGTCVCGFFLAPPRGEGMYSAAGLVGFGAYACAADDWRRLAAALVVVNGVLYHLAARWDDPLRGALLRWDVACNAALCAAVNGGSRRQPWTGAGTLAALAAWRLSHAAGPPWGHVAHVLGVQGVLLACLATAWPPLT
jgi:hypothetical protein